VLARLARATRELTEANDALHKANDQGRQLAASRAEVEREGVELDKTVKVAREALAPPSSGPADPQREAARLVAARALSTEARLLCGSARLLLPDATGLADVEKEVGALETQLDGAPRPAPIDAAARLRARCLDVLTRARRSAAKDGSHPDALLSEISASAGFDPSRNERGVIITLRDLFKGTALTTEAEAKLKELGRVAAAHPMVGVQIVVHDAVAPSKAEAENDKQRAEAIAKTLIAGGASAAKVKAETAGARAPLVDPADTAHRARNARVDIVFVSPVN
jgi:flagellar motor protein MotB